MGKVSPKDKVFRTPKQRRFSRNLSNKYLKPGALAQLRYSKASAVKCCGELGRKRVALFLDAKKVDGDDLVIKENAAPVQKGRLITLSDGFGFSSVPELAVDVVKHDNLPKTPRTPCGHDCEFESRLEALPMDLAVKILCHLHHDQLKSVFHVSQRIRKAVILARQFYFNFTTPDRSRQEMLRAMTPIATEHWPFVSKGEDKGFQMPSPHTPKAPRHGPRPPSRLKYTEMRQVAAVLFQETSIPSRCLVSSVLSKPLCKNRILFYEDELCKAVAQNKLL